MTERTEVTKNISHPMEDILDIEPGTTIATKIERNTEIAEDAEYDTKDDEIEEQIQEVYDSAMTAFESQMDESELVEGKYKARNGEVAVQFLNAALTAIKEKNGLKQHKDKIAIAKGKLTGSKTTNNLIIADRNDLLKQILGKDSEPEREIKVVNPDE